MMDLAWQKVQTNLAFTIDEVEDAKLVFPLSLKNIIILMMNQHSRKKTDKKFSIYILLKAKKRERA
jgi:hypothetical protein